MFAIVRLRGEVNLRPGIKSTLAMLHMHRVNHCIVVKEDEHYYNEKELINIPICLLYNAIHRILGRCSKWDQKVYPITKEFWEEVLKGYSPMKKEELIWRGLHEDTPIYVLSNPSMKISSLETWPEDSEWKILEL